jgi:hypothetical protein
MPLRKRPPRRRHEQHLAALPCGSGQALLHVFKTPAGQVGGFAEAVLDALQFASTGCRRSLHSATALRLVRSSLWAALPKSRHRRFLILNSVSPPTCQCKMLGAKNSALSLGCSDPGPLPSPDPLHRDSSQRRGSREAPGHIRVANWPGGMCADEKGRWNSVYVCASTWPVARSELGCCRNGSL